MCGRRGGGRDAAAVEVTPALGVCGACRGTAAISSPQAAAVSAPGAALSRCHERARDRLIACRQADHSAGRGRAAAGAGLRAGVGRPHSPSECSDDAYNAAGEKTGKLGSCEAGYCFPSLSSCQLVEDALGSAVSGSTTVFPCISGFCRCPAETTVHPSTVTVCVIQYAVAVQQALVCTGPEFLRWP